MWSSRATLVPSANMLYPNSRSTFFVGGIVLTIFLIAGILIGRFGMKSDIQHVLNVEPSVIEEISAENIGLNLRYLTSVPHVAGTAQDMQQAQWMRDRFVDAGLDEVKVVPYEVLLSYPKRGMVNTVSLIDNEGRINFTTAGRQPPLGSSEEFSEEVMHNFNAYSANGVAEGKVVYAHYGRKKDYQYLQSRGINVSGHIVLIRIGAIFRGAKVELAERNGAIGVILFSDRQEKTSQNRNFTYPDSSWLPGKGTEYGHVGRLRGGDLLTPFYPAIESAYRINERDHPGLPKIPVQSIGYEEAEVILHSISPENEAPSSWEGKLEAPYNLGPNLRYPGWKVRVDVSVTNQMRVIYNTIGILRGSIEKDRYVLLGNHRDAWVFGALDPSSGTASMVEIARVFGKMKTEQNWRPRRSIVFCSWGAKEYGQIGSYEWTQQHAKVLGQRAVAYLNVDAAVGGNRSLYGEAFPTLKQLLIDATKSVPNPNRAEVESGRHTVFDTWLTRSPDRENYKIPLVANLGGGSDFEGFAYVVGVPSADFGYAAHGIFPTYHSLYDSYHLVSNIVDRGFVHHQAVARIWAIMAIKLADSVILPLDIEAYSIQLNRSISMLDTAYGGLLQKKSVSLTYLRRSVEDFTSAVETFRRNQLSNVDPSDLMEVRRINDKLMLLERFFIDPRGLPDHPETNHIVFSTSSSDSHTFSGFAGLVDLIAKVDDESETNDPDTWKKIRHHLSVITFFINEAARSLDEDF